MEESFKRTIKDYQGRFQLRAGVLHLSLKSYSKQIVLFGNFSKDNLPENFKYIYVQPPQLYQTLLKIKDKRIWISEKDQLVLHIKIMENFRQFPLPLERTALSIEQRVTKENENLHSVIRELQKQLREKKDNLTELESNLTKLDEQYRIKKRQCSAHQERINKLSSRNNDLQNQVDQYEMEFTRYRRQNSQKTEKINLLQSQYEIVFQMLKEAQLSLSKKEQDYSFMVRHIGPFFLTVCNFIRATATPQQKEPFEWKKIVPLAQKQFGTWYQDKPQDAKLELYDALEKQTNLFYDLFKAQFKAFIPQNKAMIKVQTAVQCYEDGQQESHQSYDSQMYQISKKQESIAEEDFPKIGEVLGELSFKCSKIFEKSSYSQKENINWGQLNNLSNEAQQDQRYLFEYYGQQRLEESRMEKGWKENKPQSRE